MRNEHRQITIKPSGCRLTNVIFFTGLLSSSSIVEEPQKQSCKVVLALFHLLTVIVRELFFSLIFVSCIFSMTLVNQRVLYFFSSRSLNQRLFLRCLSRILNIFSNISFLIYWIFPSGSNDYTLECAIRFKRIFKWCLRFFALIEFSNRNLTEFFDKTEKKRESARNVGLILPSTCLILLTHFFSHSYTAIYDILHFPSGGVFNFKQFLDLCL